MRGITLESKTILLNGKEIELGCNDLVSFYPFDAIYYKIFGFNTFSDSNILSVIEDTDIIARHVDNISSVIQYDNRAPIDLPSTDRVAKRRRERTSRIEQALEESKDGKV